MIFNNILPFSPSPGPHGVGPKKCAVAHPIHVSSTHTKFCWISSNDLGGDSVTDGRTDGQTEAFAISSSFFFFKSVGIMTNGSLMKVKSIAECSTWSILQYF